MTVRLESVHPVLMSRDLAASIRFYERLGFSVTFQDDSAETRYAGIKRDDVELHLQWHDRTQWAHPVDRPAYRFVVRDVDALHREFRDNGALNNALTSELTNESPWQSPGDTPWGTREFHLRDPDGNGLQFYRLL